MNKKQLIVAWVVGLLACFIFLSAPIKYVLKTSDGTFVRYSEPAPGYANRGNAELRWEIIVPRLLTVLILGGLLIYTLRDKKK